MALPHFKYHPDPLDTGSIVPSDAQCVCCGQQRGYVYTGPVYSEKEYVECICPWCIADGSAHEMPGVFFHDPESIPGGASDDPEVSEKVVEEVCFRTPGFSGWQQEQWCTCCDDAAAFLGRAGWRELTERWPEAIVSIRRSTALEGAEWESFFNSLDRDAGPTAYVFRCLHCGEYGGYQDCH